MINYGFTVILDTTFENAVELVTEKLKEQGFGVMATIDVAETLNKKLGINFIKYVILGACNPSLAHKALQAEENIGLLLPCNFIVYEKEGRIIVSAIKPTTAMAMIDNAQLKKVAAQVESRIKQVVDSVAAAAAVSTV